MSPAVTAVWSLFLAGVVSLTVLVVAFATAMVVAQRRRFTMQREHAQRLLGAQEEERAWVARELHDDMLQRVALIRHELDTLWGSLATGATARQAQRLKALTTELADLGEALRSVAHRLHPTIVDQLGLHRALEALAGEMGHAGLTVGIITSGVEQTIPAETAHTAYRIAQEALRNVVKHAGVPRAELALSVAKGALVLSVSDEGHGFDRRQDGRGLGLVSMVERAALVRGSVSVTSRPGAGTTIEATLPLGPA